MLGVAFFPERQAHLPEAQAVQRETENLTVSVCVSMIVCDVLSPPPAEAIFILPPHSHPPPHPHLGPSAQPRKVHLLP